MATRKPRPLNLSSHTELSTLSQCERRWRYQYVDKIRGEKSEAMIRGIVLGQCCNEFWKGIDWRPMLRTLVLLAEAEANGFVPELEDVDLIQLEMVEAQPYADVYWLMKRYERQYEGMLGKVKVLGQEIDCRAKIPGTTQVHQAVLDELWQIGKRKYMVERKSFGRNDKAELVDYDPQLTNNFWVAQEHLGIKLDGIIWDGIYTHRWVPERPTQKAVLEDAPADVLAMKATEQRDWARLKVAAHPGIERPDSDSFQMLWLDRTPKHIEAAQREIRGQLRRRAQLRKGNDPIRNIGPFCKNCPAKVQCFEDLAFPQAFDVVA
jgi:hypothetical protein